MDSMVGVAFERAALAVNGGASVVLIGQSGLGKRRWCLQQAAALGPGAVVVSKPLLAASVNRLRDTLAVRPASCTAVVLDLTGASPDAQDALLRTVEETDRGDYIFLMHSDDDNVITPLISRALFFSVPLLSDLAVYDICIGSGMTDEEATTCTLIGKGRPGAALTALATLREKRRIQQMFEACRDADTEALDHLCEQATHADIDLLRVAVVEARTGRWRLWQQSEVRALEGVLDMCEDLLRGSTPIPALTASAIMYAALNHLAGRV